MSEYEIVKQVQTAQTDRDAADALIRQYMPFIKAETAKFLKRAPQEGVDEELSIAMFAFYEAMMAYHRGRGAFLRLASLAIRNRLIDFHRKEQRHLGILSLDHATDDEEEMRLGDHIPDARDEASERDERLAAQKEIMEYVKQLSTYGVSMTDVAENSPKQDRTLDACMKALDYAKRNPEILRQMIESKKLPLQALVMGAGVERKTLERHRKYVIAILLAYTNGYEIIRGHLHQLQRREATI